MIGRFSAVAITAAVLFAGAAAAQDGSKQLSVEEMERALGVGETAAEDEAPRFRAPSFEIGDAGSSSSSAPSPPRSSAARSFDVPIEFDFGSTQIARSFAPTIDRVADVLQRNPELRLKIRGHTDDVGSAEANAALSRRRAEAVRYAILERGIANSRLAAEGAGETMLIPGVAPASRRNRRVEFLRTQ
jgi:outer membrane protein OmpA-like peptidoglycan-associated protein